MTSAPTPRRAIFLDRDGTICEEMGYLNHISRFRLFPFAASAVRRFNQAGIPVIAITNQSGVARGFFPEELIHLVHQKLAEELAAAGARLDGIYYCPHKTEDNCGCRKPRPGLLERATREHHLALEGSYLISDRYADLEMGQAVGCRNVLVLTGYGRGEYEWNRARWSHVPHRVAENLESAAEMILKELR